MICFPVSLCSLHISTLFCVVKFYAYMEDDAPPPPFLQSLASELLVSFVPSINRLPTFPFRNPRIIIKADDAEQLPTDLIWFEILPRLPPKSHLRIRYVCKSWSTLTRNPSFLTAYRNFHCNISRQSHLLLITWDAATMQHHLFSSEINQEDETPTPTTHHLLTLSSTKCDHYGAQSINGLVCFHLSNFMAVFNNMKRPDHPVRIFNTTTLECITIPYSLPTYPTSYVTYHFGFNPLSDEYKILQVQRLENDSRGLSSWVYQIFTLGTSSWRHIEEDFDLDHLVPYDSLECHFCKGGVYADGVMYWLTRDIIVVFEFGEEKFRVMPLPQGSRLHSRPKLVEMGGCLAIIDLREKGMELWILKDYINRVWVNECTTFTARPPKSVEYLITLGTIHTGEELLLRPQMRKVSRKVMVHFYNRKSNMFKSREVTLPQSMFPSDNCLQILTIYEEENIAPLR